MTNIETRKITKGNKTVEATYRVGTSDERVLKEVIDQQTYRKSKIDFYVEEGEHWLDLGANIGAFGLYCGLLGATADCWEPDPDCFQLLTRNMRQFKGFSLHQSAVTAHEEPTLQFYKGARPEDHYRYTAIKSSRPHTTLPNTFAGQVFTSPFSTKGPPQWDGVKMDIEGSELDLIDQEYIPFCNKLVMEYHLGKDRSMKNFHKRMDILRKYFKTVSYIPSLDAGYANDLYPGFYDRLVFCKR